MKGQRAAARRPYRVGVDVGGTFTDLVAVNEGGGTVHLVKRPTTPDDQSEGVAEGLVALLGAANISAGDVGYLGHGTTVCINAMLQRKGALTALITTPGMRDLLELRRQVRPHLYDLQADKPEPVIPRHLRREVSERTLFDGTALRPIDLGEAQGVVQRLAREGVAALAICFLHSYVNPGHERAVKELVQRLCPSMYVSASSDVLAEFREFERLSTTALNAYVGPVMDRYLAQLEARVGALGFAVRPFIVQSNGGVATIGQVRQRPVFTMASGPSAGVAGATFVAESAHHDRIITFDMGGTSTDVCVVAKGAPITASQKEYQGYPVKGAMLDVDSVGAGGGSLAWIDAGGFLRVGPQSAGAEPGPACYGRGGTAPTVTDANLVLGRLAGDSPLGGATRLDARAAQAAVETLCPGLNLSPTDAALGVLTVVNTNMASAIRLATVERGLDPRTFTLVAYGGAGPMHAARVAASLGIPTVLVPLNPGVLCALGLLVTDVRAEFSRTAIRRTEGVSAAEIDALFRTLEDQAREWAQRGGLAVRELVLTRSIDMRYVRQNYELSVAAAGVATGEIERRFHREHRRLFGHDSSAEPTELVTFRVSARIPVPRPRLPRAQSASPLTVKMVRPVRFHDTDDFIKCPVYERGKLSSGAKFIGPAIVEQFDCTTVIEPGQPTVVDPWGNLLISVRGKRDA